MRNERTSTVYVSRPWQNWAFAAFVFFLLSLFFIMAIREGTPLLVWQAWPAYAVTAIFLPLAVLMLSARAIRVAAKDGGELVVVKHRIFGAGAARPVHLKAPQTVEVGTTETSDTDTYHVDILDARGTRLRVTAQQINSKARAEAIATRIRSLINAAASGARPSRK